MSTEEQENPELDQYMLKVAGKNFRCPDCRCNVFTKPDPSKHLYICNGCGARFEGE